MEIETPWYRLLRTPDERIRFETHAPMEDLPEDAARRLAADLQPILQDLENALTGEAPIQTPDDDPELSIVEARSSLLHRWAQRAGGRERLPPEASSVVFTLLAAGLEPDDSSRRFIADWYLQTAWDGLRDRGVGEEDRRRLFSTLIQEAWRMLRSELPPQRALLLGTRLERRVVQSLPGFEESDPPPPRRDDPGGDAAGNGRLPASGGD